MVPMIVKAAPHARGVALRKKESGKRKKVD
jgi:hypothetical protein